MTAVARAREGQGGFSLVEVLIALVIAGSALVTVQLVSFASVLHQTRRENETIALGLAEEVLERSLASPAVEPETSFEPPFERFSREVTVTPWTARPALHEVTVTIRWPEADGGDTLTLHTLVTDG
jgi:prepilin-type N-terminal cleavage/methylation domain-containing protein